MDLDKNSKQATEKQLSDQFAEFVDLTDEDLEEIDILELGNVYGGRCGGGCGCRCGCGCGCRCGCGCGCGCGCRCGCGHCGCGRRDRR